MYEREELLPLLVASYEWIAGQDTLCWTPCGNIPEFMPLDNSLNRDILHSLCFHCFLSRFVLDGDGKDEEESNIRFSPLEISFGVEKLKRILLSSSPVPSPSSKKRLKTQ